MTVETNVRHMTLTHPSHCGNPECDRVEGGQLLAGADVVVINKRIYCSEECAAAFAVAHPPRKPRKAPTPKS